MLLRGKLVRGSWAIDAFVGAVFKGRGGDSLGMGRGFNSATILTKFSGGFSSYLHDDRTTIGPRSGHDQGLIVVIGFRRSSSNQVGAIPPRKTCDRGSIAARSDRDPGVLPCFVCAVR